MIRRPGPCRDIQPFHPIPASNIAST
jgi:hypothetical protein